MNLHFPCPVKWPRLFHRAVFLLLHWILAQTMLKPAIMNRRIPWPVKCLSYFTGDCPVKWLSYFTGQLFSFSVFQHLICKSLVVLWSFSQLFSFSAFQLLLCVLSKFLLFRTRPFPFHRLALSAFQLFSFSAFDSCVPFRDILRPNQGHSCPVPGQPAKTHFCAWKPSASIDEMGLDPFLERTIDLANDWGYALTLSDYATSTVASNVTRPGTFDYGMAQLAKNQSHEIQAFSSPRPHISKSHTKWILCHKPTDALWM